MRHLEDLVNALATTLSAIPPLMAALAPVDPIVPYIDINPDHNSVEKAIYQMQAGQLLVHHTDTKLDEGQMSRWSHALTICVRALPGQSTMALCGIIMDGVPVPGDGLRWYDCPILDGLYPTKVTDIELRTDTEHVDYYAILTQTAETGDWPKP